MKTLFLGTFIATANAALYNTTIQTKYGVIQGYPAFSSAPNNNLSNCKDFTVWKGIPFAASTAGNNRDFGPICPSSVGGFGGYGGPGGPGGSGNSTGGSGPSGGAGAGSSSNYTVSEECLNLNIWSAGKKPNRKLPVIMWSYPAESTAADALFDGGGMASKGFVFVNYNYRTGSFGWLAHPELSQERFKSVGVNSSRNWRGMLDQFSALKWVHANIAAFGGDPDHITVMGQSAGSVATYHIVNSPLTKGLIVGAVIESGLRSPYDPLASSLAENYKPLSYALETGVNYAASLNCSTITCMRSLPMESLIIQFMSSTFDFTATLDYYAMPDTYINTLKSGPANNVPIITGNTKDESGASTSTNLTVAQYIASIESQYGANSTLAAQFP